MFVNVKENRPMARIVRMNVVFVVALFAGLVLGLVGCSNKNKSAQAKSQPKSSAPAGGGGGTTAAPAPAALTGKTWNQTMVDGAEIPAPADAQRKASLTFGTDGKATGYTGVNRITGTYTVDGQNLKFGNLAMTRVAGSEAQMAAETKVAEALRATTGYRITDGKLELTAGDRVVARYE